MPHAAALRVRIEVYEDAFRFASPVPVLAYFASMWIDYLDAAKRAAFLARLEERIRDVVDRDGDFRVPKRSGCFVAEI